MGIMAMLQPPTATLQEIDMRIMDMLPWTDMPITDTLHHPMATLPGIDMGIMDMLHRLTATPLLRDTPTMDTLHHPTLPWTDMRIMDTSLPLTTTPQGSNMAGAFKATLLHPRVTVFDGPSFYIVLS